MSQQLAYATLGGGCFWCLEAVYQQAEGVRKVTSGYAGGKAETANYNMVASGATRHAEVVQLQYDPEIISFSEILDIFWTIHDPTTLNRQGNDVGPQYRSVVFYHDQQQQAETERSAKETAPQIWDDPIVTEISPFEAFYPAEDSHQDYYQKVGNRNPYCTFIIGPKVQKFRKKFAEKVKS